VGKTVLLLPEAVLFSITAAWRLLEFWPIAASEGGNGRRSGKAWLENAALRHKEG